MSLSDDFNINLSYNQVKSKLSTYDSANEFYQLDQIKSDFQSNLQKYSGEVIALAYAIQFSAEVE